MIHCVAQSKEDIKKFWTDEFHTLNHHIVKDVPVSLLLLIFCLCSYLTPCFLRQKKVRLYADFDGGDTFKGEPEAMGTWAEKEVFPAVVSYAKLKGWMPGDAKPTCFVSSKNRPGKASYHLIVSLF